jgi:hypothetical protein
VIVRPAVAAPRATDAINRSGVCACRGSAQQVADKHVVELAGDLALEAADDLGLGPAFGGAPLGVGAARWQRRSRQTAIVCSAPLASRSPP